MPAPTSLPVLVTSQYSGQTVSLTVTGDLAGLGGLIGAEIVAGGGITVLFGGADQSPAPAPAPVTPEAGKAPPHRPGR